MIEKLLADIGTLFTMTHGAAGSGVPWWIWPLALLVTSFLIGIVASVAGIGGSTLFVPIVSSFFPFNFDFIRGSGLFVALACSLSAAPKLLKLNLANLRLVISLALVASASSILGAYLGLALPQNVLKILLGVLITSIALFFVFTKNSEFPKIGRPDALACYLNIGGTYFEPSTGQDVTWSVWRLPLGLVLFAGIGVVAGMFGIGAGWANVPVLNLFLGAPLKIAVGTSLSLLAITDTSAAWIYLNQGAVLPMITIPAVVGIMLGSRVGVRMLKTARPKSIRYVVIVMLLFAGLKSLLNGLGWG
ncbi:Transmembrane protein TauE-like [Acididesulfobacillus acetoxydans]|uniref:Probable membrane transporter protein n=1 Tax=Acididesulfobacillus acetoxydans TaxID=1561005 RepID=A0A8S0WVX7_9FIRM|nr:sulfite exporter TauE/SafE family protein [Acididesulfobacillus acetoxydans]CAA7599931.1 Transmembrane protein TauE-like [Acididesulfobacillus acetoxydans]CEJ07977.1 Sulfite exporter TauE/SafE [Acididesulfobacillus acetoxydans]